MSFQDIRIREARNKLACRFDPENDLIEVVVRGYGPCVIDLAEYRPNPPSLTFNVEGCRIEDDSFLGDGNH